MKSRLCGFCAVASAVKVTAHRDHKKVSKIKALRILSTKTAVTHSFFELQSAVKSAVTFLTENPLFQRVLPVDVTALVPSALYPAKFAIKQIFGVQRPCAAAVGARVLRGSDGFQQNHTDQRFRHPCRWRTLGKNFN